MSNPRPVRIGLLGYQGRLGSIVRELIEAEFAQTAVLVACVGRGDSPEPLFFSDVVIDFSSPEAMSQLAERALRLRSRLPAFVIGSAKWNPDQRQALDELATHAPVYLSSVYSKGALALLQIVRESAHVLQKLGYSPCIEERHHRTKKDSPSATARSLRVVLRESDPEAILIRSYREGDVISDHKICFSGPEDRIEIAHYAQDRKSFARGAIECAIWLAGKVASGEIKRGMIDHQQFVQDLGFGPRATGYPKRNSNKT